MSAALLERRFSRTSQSTGTFSVCILHKGRWHMTPVCKRYDDVIGMAEDAYRRSGLPVQIRDADNTILFEANDERAEKTVAERCQETLSW